VGCVIPASWLGGGQRRWDEASGVKKQHPDGKHKHLAGGAY